MGTSLRLAGQPAWWKLQVQRHSVWSAIEEKPPRLITAPDVHPHTYINTNVHTQLNHLDIRNVTITKMCR